MEPRDTRFFNALRDDQRELLRAPESATEVRDRRFEPRDATESQRSRMVAVRSAFKAVEDVLVYVCPPSRYRALAITALEEACMWAIKSISHENG